MPSTRLSTSRIARVLEQQLLSQFASFQESETEQLIQGLALIGLDYLLSSNLSNHRTSTSSSSPLSITTVLQLSEKTAKDIEESEQSQESETGLRKQLSTIKEQLTILTSKFNAIDDTTNGGYLPQRYQVIPKPTGNSKKQITNHQTFLTQPSQHKSGSHGSNTSSTQRKSLGNNNNNSYSNNDSKDRSNSKSKAHNSSLNIHVNTVHDTPTIESRKPSSAWRGGKRKTSHHSVNSSWDDNTNNQLQQQQHLHSVSLEENTHSKQNNIVGGRKQSYQSNPCQKSQEQLLPAKKITETTYQRTEPVVVQTKHHLDDQETKEILHPLKAYQSERGYQDNNKESDYSRQFDSNRIEQYQDKQGMNLQKGREGGDIIQASKSPYIQQQQNINGQFERQQYQQPQESNNINLMQGQQYYQQQQYINPKNISSINNIQSKKVLQTPGQPAAAPTGYAPFQSHISQPSEYPVDFKKHNQNNISNNNNNHHNYPRTPPPHASYNTTRSVLMRQEMNEQKKKQELLQKQKAQRQQQQPTYLRNVTSRIRADVQQSKEANRKTDKEVLFLLRDPACPQTHVFTAKQLEIQEEQQQQQVANSNLLLLKQINENIDYSNKVINQQQHQQRRQYNQQDQQDIEQQYQQDYQQQQQQQDYYMQQHDQYNHHQQQQFANRSYERATEEQDFNQRDLQQNQEDQEELYDESSQDDFERATQQGFDTSNNFSRQLNSPTHSFPYKSQYSSQVYTSNPQLLQQQFQQQLSAHKDNDGIGQELYGDVERQTKKDRQQNMNNYYNRNQVEKNKIKEGGEEEQEGLEQQNNESQSASFIEKSYDYAAPRQHYNQRQQQQQQPHQWNTRSNNSIQQFEDRHINGQQDHEDQQNQYQDPSNVGREIDRVEKDESSMSSSFAPFETDLDMKLLLQNEGFFQKIFDKEEEGNAAADFSQTKEF